MRRREIEQMRWEVEDNLKKEEKQHEDTEKKIVDVNNLEEELKIKLKDHIASKENKD